MLKDYIEKIENVKENSNHAFLDFVCVIASLVVISMHVMINILKDFSAPGNIFGRLIAFNMFSVYIFFISSGYSFMKYKTDISVEVSCRLIIKRYIGLMLFAIPYSFIEILWNANCVFQPFMVKKAICNALLGYTWDHLWFMYMLLGVYLFMPFLIKIYKNENKILLPAFTLILLVLCFFGVELWISSPIYIFQRISFSNVIFLVTVGAFLYRYDFFKTLNKWIIFLIMLMMGILWFKCQNVFNYINNQFFIILFAIMSFVFCQKFFIEKNKIISIMASHNYVIYLIHVLFLHLMTKVVKYNPYIRLENVGIILATLFIYVLSLLSAILIEKIPYIGILYKKRSKNK